MQRMAQAHQQGLAHVLARGDDRQEVRLVGHQQPAVRGLGPHIVLEIGRASCRERV